MARWVQLILSTSNARSEISFLANMAIIFIAN
jgi:hypothetical protein